MNMDASKLPLNKKRTIIAQKFIIAVAKRINSNEVIISYINLKDHEEVLRVLQKIDNGTKILQYADPEYWDIYSDGNYISDIDISLFKDVESKIKISTREKSLEIESFDNKEMKQIKKGRVRGQKSGIGPVQNLEAAKS